MNEILDRLKANTPAHYLLEWNGHQSSPIRYRIEAPKDRIEVYNFIWTEAITKFTGVQPFDKESFTRFTVPYEKTNISISIFPSTGTIMLQSNLSAYWADSFMPKICQYINKDEKGYLTPSSCIVCEKDGTNEMVVCDNEFCQSWTHNDCAGLTEEAARSSSYWCKLCVDDFVERQEESSLEINYQISTPSQNKHLHNKTNTIETDISSILNLSDTSPETTMSSTNSNKYQGNPAKPLENLESSHSYLKQLHSKLVDLSKDDSVEEDLPEVTEIKNLLNYLREEVAKELSYSEKIKSNENLDQYEDQSSNKPIDLTNKTSPHQNIGEENKSLDKSNNLTQNEYEKNHENDLSKQNSNDEIHILEKSTSMPTSQQNPENDKSMQNSNDQIQVLEEKSTSITSQQNNSIEPSMKHQLTEEVQENELPGNCLIENIGKAKMQNLENPVMHENCYEINMLKAELNMKNSDISMYIDKINHLEELLNLKSSPKQTKHRLEHRNITSVIKEYTNLEERLKVLQKQLNEEINFKKHYKNKLVAAMKEKEETLKSLKALQNKIPQNSNHDNDKIIQNLRKEREEAQLEIINLKQLIALEKSVKESGFEAKDDVIINLQDQIKMDDEIKIDLNNKLEEAFCEIKDLKDKVSQTKRPTKNKSTNTINESDPQFEHDTQIPIDLSLPNRRRAEQNPHPEIAMQPQNYFPPRNENRSENFHRPRDRNKTAREPRQNQFHRQSVYGNQAREHSNQTEQVDFSTDVIEVSNIHRTGLNERNLTSSMTLNARFTPKTKRQQRPKITDYYDFALKDNRNLRTKNRPICPWYQKNQCNSDVCVYQHPQNIEPRNEQGITLDDISDTTSIHERPREICWYHLQKRCWFGSSCYNKHVNNY